MLLSLRKFLAINIMENKEKVIKRTKGQLGHSEEPLQAVESRFYILEFVGQNKPD